MTGLRSPTFLIALVLALGLGLPIALAQLDRQARSTPALSRFVPSGSGGFADEQRARQALLTNPAMAESHVRNVVRSRPIDGSHLSLLAIWAAETGHGEIASRTLTEAARRGWRDTFVQISVLASAVAQNNLLAAGQRLDALARNGAGPGILVPAMEVLLAADGGDLAVARHVAGSEDLRDGLVDYARQKPGSGRVVADIIAVMPQFGSELDCARRADIARVLMQQGDAAVFDAWGSGCAKDSGRTLAFTFSENRSDPFAWNYQRGAGLSAIAGSSRGTATLSNRTLLDKVVAWRFLALPVGPHVIAVSASAEAERHPIDPLRAKLQLFVKCLGEGKPGHSTLASAANPKTVAFTVPEGCVTQQLGIKLGRGRVDDLELFLQ